MRFSRFISVLLALSVAAIAADKKRDKPAPAPQINKLAWLAGSWRMEKTGRVVEEQWLAPAGGVMLGVSRTVAKNRVVEFEFMQIREGPGGTLFFVAQPSGQPEAAFQLLTHSSSTPVCTYDSRLITCTCGLVHAVQAQLVATLITVGTANAAAETVDSCLAVLSAVPINANCSAAVLSNNPWRRTTSSSVSAVR